MNGHCEDSKHYLLELEEWKNENENITVRFSNSALYIVAADVQGLYHDIKRTLLMEALKTPLQERTNYGKEVRKILKWLTDLCLKNVIIQYQNKFYNQKDGIITGDNHSVSQSIALYVFGLSLEIWFYLFLEMILFVFENGFIFIFENDLI